MRQVFEVVTPGGKVVSQEAVQDGIKAAYMMPGLQIAVQDVTAKRRGNGEWISVEEKLPERGFNLVWVWYKGEVCEGRLSHLNSETERIWVVGNDIGRELITLWQPIMKPESPEL